MSKRLSATCCEGVAASGRRVVQVKMVQQLVCLLTLIVADVAAISVTGQLLRAGQNVPRLLIYNGLLPLGTVIDLFYLLGAAFIVVRYVAGDYTKRQLFWDDVRVTTIGLVAASIPSLFLAVIVPANYSIYTELWSWAVVIVALPLFRQIARWALSQVHMWQLSTALIGDMASIEEAKAAFQGSLSLGFDVQFLILQNKPDEESLHQTNITWISSQGRANIINRLSESGCLQVVFATSQPLDDMANELVSHLLAIGIHVAIIPPLQRLPLLGLSSNLFFGRELLLLHIRNNLARLPSRILKRCFDVVGSVFLIVALSPLLAAISAYIKWTGGGSVLFVQHRVGYSRKKFACIKFRTMRPDADKVLQQWKTENSPWYREYVASNFKLKNDPRVTPFGHWLRKSSIDELPQLFNVLIGDMSLVGPRPLLERELGEYGVALELYQRVRPGITGLWQISGRSHTAFSDRIASDEWYIKNWSFWYDIVILINTVGVLLKRDGAY